MSLSPIGASSKPYVPERFRERVLAHAYLAGNPRMGLPLILGIQGRAGDGKSYQCRAVAKELHLKIRTISSSELAHELEGRPVEVLRNAYIGLAAEIASSDSPGFLLIDDFDMGIAGIRSNATYTVNTQLLTAKLMSLCDDPLCGSLRRGVPIIITGNDLGVLHGPLRRHGRMDFFEWTPSKVEMQTILARVFDGLPVSVQVDELLAKYPEMPLSFFVQVAESIKRLAALQLVRGLVHAIPISKFEADWANLNKADQHESTVDKLYEIADALVASHLPRTFLDDRGMEGS